MLSVRFSADGKYIISSSYDNSVKLWSIDEQREKFSLDQLDETAKSIALKGKYIAIQ